MGIERHLDKAEKFIEASFANFTEALWFKKPESVGTMRVLDVFPDRNYFKGYDMVILDFGKLSDFDESPIVYRVPKGLIKPGSVVEVVTKKAKITTDPIATLVAIRPFVKERYGKYFGKEDLNLSQQFGYNMKDSDSSKMFFKKFFSDRLRKEPTPRI